MSLNIAIIGAGMAGVSAAHALLARGWAVTLFEKSRGYGGRCASKRWEGHVVDHGAQFFTQRDEGFRSAVKAASGADVLRMAGAVVDESGCPLPNSGRWFHREGNSRLVRDMARGLVVRTEVQVDDAVALLRRAGGDFDHVVSTAPLPQTARLFRVQTDFDYVPCLTVLLAYDGTGWGWTQERYAVSDHRGPLAWSACENHKPGRIAAGQTVMVAQMAEGFSREHLESTPEEFAARVRPLVEERWGLATESFRAALGHRWRFARVAEAAAPMRWPEGCHFVGDALRASRVEDAWLAGASVAELIHQRP